MKILLLKTFPLSLHDWNSVGILNRELSIYKNINLKYKVDYTLVTYGDKSDLEFREKSAPINIFPYFKNINKPNNYYLKLLYSLFLPFYLRNIFKETDIIQTNQFWGSWVALMDSWLYKKHFILREGFEFYHFAKQLNKSKIYLIIIKNLSKLIYKKSSLIVVSSNNIKNFIIKEFLINEKKITVIPNFIDTKIFDKDS